MGHPRRTGWLAAASVALLVSAATAVVVLGPRDARGSARPAPTATAAPAPAVPVTPDPPPPPPPPPPPALIATLSAATPYSATAGAAPVGTLAAENPFGAPEVVAVIGVQGTGPDMWLHVRLPVRPNGSTGWIRAAGVSLTETSYQLLVDRASRTLTVTLAGRPVLSTPVAVGTPDTPTPPGDTYLWELIRPDDPGGPYGPYIFGLAEFSDTYATFNGGDAQIGIHGQDEPWSIGQAASHGCVRLPNDVISKLAGMLPLGTPVSIR